MESATSNVLFTTNYCGKLLLHGSCTRWPSKIWKNENLWDSGNNLGSYQGRDVAKLGKFRSYKSGECMSYDVYCTNLCPIT
ncbi:hypothetical protein V6N13_058275 [Hibiscus sabdariffa]